MPSTRRSSASALLSVFFPRALAKAQEDVGDLLLIGRVTERPSDPLRDGRDRLRRMRDDERDLRVEAGRAPVPGAIRRREVEALARRVAIAVVREEHDVAGPLAALAGG